MLYHQGGGQKLESRSQVVGAGFSALYGLGHGFDTISALLWYDLSGLSGLTGLFSYGIEHSNSKDLAGDFRYLRDQFTGGEYLGDDHPADRSDVLDLGVPIIKAR